MSNTSVAVASFVVLACPAASFARHGGSAAFARRAGSAGVPISGFPRGPANAGGMNNVAVDRSGVGNAFKVASLPLPRSGLHCGSGSRCGSGSGITSGFADWRKTDAIAAIVAKSL